MPPKVPPKAAAGGAAPAPAPPPESVTPPTDIDPEGDVTAKDTASVSAALRSMESVVNAMAHGKGGGGGGKQPQPPLPPSPPAVAAVRAVPPQVTAALRMLREQGEQLTAIIARGKAAEKQQTPPAPPPHRNHNEHRRDPTAEYERDMSDLLAMQGMQQRLEKDIAGINMRCGVLTAPSIAPHSSLEYGVEDSLPPTPNPVNRSMSPNWAQLTNYAKTKQSTAPTTTTTTRVPMLPTMRIINLDGGHTTLPVAVPLAPGTSPGYAVPCALPIRITDDITNSARWHPTQQQLTPNRSETPQLSIAGDNDYHAVLTEFYTQHNPRKVAQVDWILRQFVGEESQLLILLALKYNVPVPALPFH